MCGDERSERGWSPTAVAARRRRLDELIALLADRRRRDLLYRLLGTDVTDVETLAADVAAAAEGVPPEDVPPEVRRDVRADLVHRQLPKLANAGAVEYDHRTETVRCREFPPMLRQLLDRCRDVEADD